MLHLPVTQKPAARRVSFCGQVWGAGLRVPSSGFLHSLRLLLRLAEVGAALWKLTGKGSCAWGGSFPEQAVLRTSALLSPSAWQGLMWGQQLSALICLPPGAARTSGSLPPANGRGGPGGVCQANFLVEETLAAVFLLPQPPILAWKEIMKSFQRLRRAVSPSVPPEPCRTSLRLLEVCPGAPPTFLKVHASREICPS